MFQESRLQMGYSFSLGLNFLVGGSILRTTITPRWEDIGRLAVIIVIRTVLNYLLLQNIHKPVPRDSHSESDNYNNSSNKSLYENIHSTTLATEKRLRIDIAAIQEMIQKENVKVLWTSSAKQIADSFTRVKVVLQP